MDLGAAASLLILATSPGPELTPIGSASTDVLTYWLSFGAIAVIGGALFWLFIWPGKLLKRLIAEARADLLEQVQQQQARAERAEARAEKAEGKNEDLRDRLVQLVAEFTATTDALLPVLQSVVRYQEYRGDTRSEPRP